MRRPDSLETRIAALTAKTVAAQRQSRRDFDWDRPVGLPIWLPKRLAASAITHFHVGELATAEMCSQIRDHLDIPLGGDFLDLQALDERRHARLYSLYLDKLGGADPRPSMVGRAYDRAASWQGAPQAIILAFHGILEGESMRLQQAIDKWLPCPLFKEISAVIARDEARHIAFGRLYLQETLPSLPRTERLRIFRWIRSLWFEAVRGAISHFAPPGMVQAHGGLAGWMANEWRKRVADMEALHLFAADERREFSGTC
jgi:hypothetical protein